MKLTSEQVSALRHHIPLDNGEQIVRIEISGKEPLPKTELNANIYRIDQSFNIIWQIQSPPPPFDLDPFVHLGRHGDKILAYRFSGFEYVVNDKTGAATQIDWHK